MDKQGERSSTPRSAATPLAVAGWVLAALLVVPVVGWLVRPAAPPAPVGLTPSAAESAAPVMPTSAPSATATATAGAVSPPDSPWRRIASTVQPTAPRGAGSVMAVTVVGERAVAVGVGLAAGAAGRARPGVLLGERGLTTWRAGEVDDGGGRYGQAGLLMQDVAALPRGAPRRLVAVGYANFEPDTEGVVWASDDDGDIWRLVGTGDPTFAGAILHAVAGGDDGLVAVGARGDPSVPGGSSAAVWTSPDGLTWDLAPIEVAGTAGAVLTDVAVHGGAAAAVGSDADGVPRIWWTDGDRPWEPADTVGLFRLGDALGDVVTTADGFLAIGAVDPLDGDGIVLVSTAGDRWRPMDGPLGALIGAGEQQPVTVLTQGNELVAAGWLDARAAVWVSRDGQPWTLEFLDDGALSSGIYSVTQSFQGLIAGGWRSGPGRRPGAALWLRPPAGRVDGGSPVPVEVPAVGR